VRPAQDTFYRIAAVLPEVKKQRGRMTGAAWRALLPYTERDVSMFHSNDIWVGDGHSFKARVQSPIHGQAFRPEITIILDWVSRKIIGWSIDLAESTLAVSAAFRDAQIRTRARPLVYYRDNGSGQTGKLIDCEIHGALARQGIASETGIPGNPQGRGVIERLWQTVFIPLAATYPTFIGEREDKDTARKVAARIAKAQRAGLAPGDLPTWPQFLEDLARCIKAYNEGHQHRALQHRTPGAVYAERLDPTSEVFKLDDSEIGELWMPEVARTPARGLIQLFGNHYFLPGLVDLLPDGASVRVRFDIHDAQRVWVLAMNGRLLGVATWNGHRKAAFPVPFIERKRAERAAGVRARALRTIERAEADAQAPEPTAVTLPEAGNAVTVAATVAASNVHFLAPGALRPAVARAQLEADELAELARREQRARAQRAARGAL
jgi:putative transposase